ncbi:hypothetical protein V1282_002105 [Nitrobacteraceae bacterium AZCC 2146]
MFAARGRRRSLHSLPSREGARNAGCPMHPFACARCRSRQNKCAQDFRSNRFHPAFRTRCASGLLRALSGGRSTPGAEDAVRRPVGGANSPLRDAPFGIEKPHDLGRRASVVVSLGSRRSRSSGLERTLCTRRTFASGLAPCDLRSGLTLPRHRIPPREHGRRERPSQWGGTRWIIVLLGILSTWIGKNLCLQFPSASWRPALFGLR